MKKQNTYRRLGQYIVADPEICHGKPTFLGTRIMVSQVLDMVAKGMDWIAIIDQCHQSITKEAIAEAVQNGDERRRDHPIITSTSSTHIFYPRL
jgi:uncharacterized protein (DUF433 family)